jgi:uncharacterized protein (DUF58 family)
MNGELSREQDGVVAVSQSHLIGLRETSSRIALKPRLARANMSGQYLSAFKGRGMEYDESRPYEPGDDIRNMDWRVTARTGKPHSKLFREERERPVLLWSDFRRSLAFGTRNCLKSVRVAEAAALLAWQAVARGDRVGGLMFSGRRHLELRPGRGKHAALKLMKSLSEFSWQAWQQLQQPPSAQAGNGDGEHALNRLAQVTRPGSLVYLLSDFRDLSAALESTLFRIRRHSEVLLLQVHDPLEAELPPAGVYRVSDGREQAEVDSSLPEARRGYRRNFRQRVRKLEDLAARSGCRLVRLSTADEPVSATLLRQLAQRGGRHG